MSQGALGQRRDIRRGNKYGNTALLEASLGGNVVIGAMLLDAVQMSILLTIRGEMPWFWHQLEEIALC